jgi:hypothetical protein
LLAAAQVTPARRKHTKQAPSIYAGFQAILAENPHGCCVSTYELTVCISPKLRCHNTMLRTLIQNTGAINMFNQLLLLLIPLAIIIVTGAWLKFKVGDAASGGPWPFQARKPLPAVEQVLWFRLTEALPDHIVLAQVQLSRLLSVKKGHNFHQ